MFPKGDNSKAQIEAFIQLAEQRAMALEAPIEDFAASLSTEMTLFLTMDKNTEMYLLGVPKLPGMLSKYDPTVLWINTKPRNGM